MGYLKEYQWELVPESLPVVKRNCPKCKIKTNYMNTEKFRVNANKNNIDIWLIYQCEKCKSTYNMTIYERINPYDITKNEYERFLANDKKLAKEYGFNIGIHNLNKAELILENIQYDVIKREKDEYCANENEIAIDIYCKYPIELRVDKLLCDNFSISRSKIKNMYEKGLIFSDESKNLLKSKVRNGMKLHILRLGDRK